jgi:pyridoxamine 5'-phosphate oxidase
MLDKILQLRKEYSLAALDETHVNSNPFIQFNTWFDEALQAQLQEPNALFLATVDESNKPSGRIVLLREANDKGFVFYTNYLSRKGIEIATNPHASMTFFWQELERQVRIEGVLEKVPESVSDDYFARRPRGSQIGAWTSPQSKQIISRAELEEEEKRISALFEGKEVKRPAHWGGYCLVPHYLEFWQGRENRLHDRICFSLTNSGWSIARLAP